MKLLSRLLAILGALAGWAGLGIQLYILLNGALGPLGGAWRFLAFFTILMNIFAACLLTGAIFRPIFSDARARLQTAATVYMTIVGAIYVLILQNLWDPQGLQLIADVLLHYAAPILAILFWLVGVPKAALKWSDPVRWTGVPLLYFVYALARAALDGFYAYPFIDVSQLGWPVVIVNAAGMLAVFLIVGLLIVSVGRSIGRGRAPAAG